MIIPKKPLILLVAIVMVAILLTSALPLQTWGPVDSQYQIKASMSGVLTLITNVNGGARVTNYGVEMPPDGTMEIKTYIFLRDGTITDWTLTAKWVYYAIFVNGVKVVLTTQNAPTGIISFTKADQNRGITLEPKIDVTGTSLGLKAGDVVEVFSYVRFTATGPLFGTVYFDPPTDMTLGVCRLLVVATAVPVTGCTLQVRAQTTTAGNIEGATVTIDGNKVYTTDSQGYATIPGLSVGSHNVIIEKTGYISQTGVTSFASDGQSNDLYFVLVYLFTPPPVPPATTDTDGDGLLDTWEIEHWGNLAQTATGDPDADGFTNLQEYQNGTDPTVDETNDGYVWSSMGYLAAIGGIIGAVLVFAFALPVPPKFRAFVSIAIALGSLVIAHLINIGELII